MTKGELINFLEPFKDETLISIGSGNSVDFDKIKYVCKEGGNPHIELYTNGMHISWVTTTNNTAT